MTQAPAVETMELRIVACEGCDQLFLVSPRRGTCPTCGGGPGVEFFTFDAGPEGVQLRGGLAVEASAPPPPEPASPNGIPSADLAPVDQDAGDVDPQLLRLEELLPKVLIYLDGAPDLEPNELRECLLGMGADPEAATTAVGRLEAVRNLLAELTRPAEAETAAPIFSREEGKTRLEGLGFTSEQAEERLRKAAGEPETPSTPEAAPETT
jgi:hypothetical protein